MAQSSAEQDPWSSSCLAVSKQWLFLDDLIAKKVTKTQRLNKDQINMVPTFNAGH